MGQARARRRVFRCEARASQTLLGLLPGVENMVLQLFNDAQQFICQLDELHRKLGFYSPEDGYGIHVRYRLCLESSTH